MKIKLLATFLLAISLFPIQGMADTIVFVQGYLGEGENWYGSGITRWLQTDGWRHGGHLTVSPQGVVSSQPRPHGNRRYHTVDLPTQRPLGYQLGFLDQYLKFVDRQYPGQSIILIGHSAGGVLSRLHMVENADANVSALITIASPHLGTKSAELGIEAGRSPLGWMAPFVMGDSFSSSQALFQELARERPGNMLGWLNRQPHPQAFYASIVHADTSTTGLSEWLVPGWSQDMNNVYALRGKVTTVRLPAGHALVEQDGEAILRLLASLRQI